MLHIPDVTLVVLAGTYAVATEAAILDAAKRVSFDDYVVFCDVAAPWREADACVVETPMRSLEALPRIYWREIYPRLRTSHALIMEWDGYPVNSEAWTDKFREYDYIGAVWPYLSQYTVGNSGFCLLSRKLLAAIHDDPAIPLKLPIDTHMSRDMRPYLEQKHGIRFAPEDIADRFSVEHGPCNFTSFGFHGIFNFLYIMDDAELKRRLDMMGKAQWGSQSVEYLGLRALVEGRRDLYRWLIQRRQQVMAS